MVLTAYRDEASGEQRVNLLTAIPRFDNSCPEEHAITLPPALKEIVQTKGKAIAGVPCVERVPTLNVGDLVLYEVFDILPVGIFISIGSVVGALEPNFHPEHGWKLRG